VTLEELDATLTIDYVHRNAILDIRVWIGSMAAPSRPDREKWRAGCLELRGLLFCAVDPPNVAPTGQLIGVKAVRVGLTRASSRPKPSPDLVDTAT
jgi:hypothetical protein